VHRAGAAAARAHARITRPAACGFQGGGGRDRRSAGGGSHVTASARCGAAERGPDVRAARGRVGRARPVVTAQVLHQAHRGVWWWGRATPWAPGGAEPARAAACNFAAHLAGFCASRRGSKFQRGPIFFIFFTADPRKKILNPPLPFSLKKSVQGVQGAQYPVYHPLRPVSYPPPAPAPAPRARQATPPPPPRRRPG
jgi:hypothetical protein